MSSTLLRLALFAFFFSANTSFAQSLQLRFQSSGPESLWLGTESTGRIELQNKDIVQLEILEAPSQDSRIILLSKDGASIRIPIQNRSFTSPFAFTRERDEVFPWHLEGNIVMQNSELASPQENCARSPSLIGIASLSDIALVYILGRMTCDAGTPAASPARRILQINILEIGSLSSI